MTSIAGASVARSSDKGTAVTDGSMVAVGIAAIVAETIAVTVASISGEAMGLESAGNSACDTAGGGGVKVGIWLVESN